MSLQRQKDNGKTWSARIAVTNMMVRTVLEGFVQNIVNVVLMLKNVSIIQQKKILNYEMDLELDEKI